MQPSPKNRLFLELLRSVLRGPIMLTEIVYKLGTRPANIVLV